MNRCAEQLLIVCCNANCANAVCLRVPVCCCCCCLPFSVSLLTLFFSLFSLSPSLSFYPSSSLFLSGLIPPPPVLLPPPLVVPPTTLLASPLLPPPPPPPPPLSTPPAYLLTATPPTISTAVPRASACPSLPARCPLPSTTSRQGKGPSPPLTHGPAGEGRDPPNALRANSTRVLILSPRGQQQSSLRADCGDDDIKMIKAEAV